MIKIVLQRSVFKLQLKHGQLYWKPQKHIDPEAIKTEELQHFHKMKRMPIYKITKHFLTPKKSKTVPLKIEKLFRKNYKAIADNLYEVKFQKAEISQKLIKFHFKKTKTEK